MFRLAGGLRGAEVDGGPYRNRAHLKGLLHIDLWRIMF
jgi:hypothetical protein